VVVTVSPYLRVVNLLSPSSPQLPIPVSDHCLTWYPGFLISCPLIFWYPDILISDSRISTHPHNLHLTLLFFGCQEEWYLCLFTRIFSFGHHNKQDNKNGEAVSRGGEKKTSPLWQRGARGDFVKSFNPNGVLRLSLSVNR